MNTDPSPSATGPLSPEQMQHLLAAGRRAQRIYGAAKLAAFNGWTIAVVAGLSLPLVLFGLSLSGLLVEAGLAVVAFNEFRGRRRLLRFDPSATRLLGWNQIALMALLIAYSAWAIHAAWANPNPYEAELRANPELRGMLGSIGNLYLAVTIAVYGGVILATIGFQGLNAWYYFTRRRYVQEYLDETPPWVRDVLNAINGL